MLKKKLREEGTVSVLNDDVNLEMKWRRWRHAAAGGRPGVSKSI